MADIPDRFPRALKRSFDEIINWAEDIEVKNKRLKSDIEARELELEQKNALLEEKSALLEQALELVKKCTKEKQLLENTYRHELILAKGWSELPFIVRCSVQSHLNLRDLINTRLVCQSFRKSSYVKLHALCLGELCAILTRAPLANPGQFCTRLSRFLRGSLKQMRSLKSICWLDDVDELGEGYVWILSVLQSCGPTLSNIVLPRFKIAQPLLFSATCLKKLVVGSFDVTTLRCFPHLEHLEVWELTEGKYLDQHDLRSSHAQEMLSLAALPQVHSCDLCGLHPPDHRHRQMYPHHRVDIEYWGNDEIIDGLVNHEFDPLVFADEGGLCVAGDHFDYGEHGYADPVPHHDQHNVGGMGHVDAEGYLVDDEELVEMNPDGGVEHVPAELEELDDDSDGREDEEVVPFAGNLAGGLVLQHYYHEPPHADGGPVHAHHHYAEEEDIMVLDENDNYNMNNNNNDVNHDLVVEEGEDYEEDEVEENGDEGEIVDDEVIDVFELFGGGGGDGGHDADNMDGNNGGGGDHNYVDGGNDQVEEQAAEEAEGARGAGSSVGSLSDDDVKVLLGLRTFTVGYRVNKDIFHKVNGRRNFSNSLKVLFRVLTRTGPLPGLSKCGLVGMTHCSEKFLRQLCDKAPKLQAIYLVKGELTNLKPLRKLAGTLWSLEFEDLRITNTESTTAVLKDLKNITSVYITRSVVPHICPDWSILSCFPKLNQLGLDGCRLRVEDFERYLPRSLPLDTVSLPDSTIISNELLEFFNSRSYKLKHFYIPSDGLHMVTDFLPILTFLENHPDLYVLKLDSNRLPRLLLTEALNNIRPRVGMICPKLVGLSMRFVSFNEDSVVRFLQRRARYAHMLPWMYLGINRQDVAPELLHAAKITGIGI